MRRPPYGDDGGSSSSRRPWIPPGERPTTVSGVSPSAPAPGAANPAHPAPRPVAPVPPAPCQGPSWRRRLFGQRSVLFIGIMLLRTIWLLVQGAQQGKDLRLSAAGAGIYLLALVIASPAHRFRAWAVGLMCGLIWLYVFVDPSQLGSPALNSWPAVFPIGMIAVIVERVFTDQIRAQRGRFGAHVGRLAGGVPRAAIGVQALGVSLFVVPVVVMSVSGLLAFGLDSEPLTDLVVFSISLPPLIGAIVYASFVLRRLRSLAPLR